MVMRGELDEAWDLLWVFVYHADIESLEEQQRIVKGVLDKLCSTVPTGNPALGGFILRTAAVYSNVLNRQPREANEPMSQID